MSKLVLVVEDDKAIRELIIEAIISEGFQATGAENGVVALTVLSTIKCDLITMDLEMPNMNGNQLLEKLTTSAPEIPVVVVSANPSNLKPNSQVKALLNKPFDLEHLLKLIDEYIQE